MDEIISVDYVLLDLYQVYCDDIASAISEVYEKIDQLAQDIASSSACGVYKGKALDDWNAYNEKLLENVDNLNKYMSMCSEYISVCLMTSAEEDVALQGTMDNMRKAIVETTNGN